jgi:hypothetical protein
MRHLAGAFLMAVVGPAGSALPAGCQREAVAGVGEDAFFESCPASRSQRFPPLYVRAGTNDLILQMDVEPPATVAAVRQTLIAIAQAAVRKLHCRETTTPRPGVGT